VLLMPETVEALGGLEGVLHDSFTRRVLVNVLHGTDRRLEDVPLEDWSLEGSLGTSVKYSGKGTVVYSSVHGESLAPQGTKGVLSPFRARLELVVEVSAGDFVERVSLGTFRVTAAGPARDFTAGGEGFVSVRVPVYVPDPADPGTFVVGV